jgi:hypothetical protein
MVLDDFLARVDETEPENVFELFLGLYRSVADSGVSEIVRRVCSPEATHYDSWHYQHHPLARSVADAIGENPNPWVEGFPAAREKLLLNLQQAQSTIRTLADGQEQAVLCIVIALRQLDSILEKILCFPPGPLSYSALPPNAGYKVVRKPRASFYSLYRAKEELPAPPPMQHGEFEQVLGLISTYVVPPLTAGQYFEWDLHRIPESIESVWRGHAQNELVFVFFSFPHGQPELRLDIQNRRFRVLDLGPNQAQLEDRVSEQVVQKLSQGASVLIFPELMATGAMRERLKSLLAAQPNRIGMLVPGSQHQETAPGVWRNRCSAIDAVGRDTNIVHDKFTRYALPEDMVQRIPQAAGDGEILEGIEVTPRRLNLYDSHTLGRIAFLICRDIIEPQTEEFLRRHFLDHVFVISMSPSLKDFQTTCSKLGRVLDCGIYVANTAFGERPEPAFLYLPVRRKQALEKCPKETHQLCEHVFRVRLPRSDV